MDNIHNVTMLWTCSSDNTGELDSVSILSKPNSVNIKLTPSYLNQNILILLTASSSTLKNVDLPQVNLAK